MTGDGEVLDAFGDWLRKQGDHFGRDVRGAEKGWAETEPTKFVHGTNTEEMYWFEEVDYLLVGILLEREDLVEYWVYERGAEG